MYLLEYITAITQTSRYRFFVCQHRFFQSSRDTCGSSRLLPIVVIPNLTTRYGLVALISTARRRLAASFEYCIDHALLASSGRLVRWCTHPSQTQFREEYNLTKILNNFDRIQSTGEVISVLGDRRSDTTFSQRSSKAATRQ